MINWDLTEVIDHFSATVLFPLKPEDCPKHLIA